jgi:hypothetical protein
VPSLTNEPRIDQIENINFLMEGNDFMQTSSTWAEDVWVQRTDTLFQKYLFDGEAVQAPSICGLSDCALLLL